MSDQRNDDDEREQIERRILDWLRTADIRYPDDGRHKFGELHRLTETTGEVVMLTEDGTITTPLTWRGDGWEPDRREET